MAELEASVSTSLFTDPVRLSSRIQALSAYVWTGAHPLMQHQSWGTEAALHGRIHAQGAIAGPVAAGDMALFRTADATALEYHGAGAGHGWEDAGHPETQIKPMFVCQMHNS